MTDTAKTVWTILRAAGVSEVGAAAMLGNMQAESALRANNAQDGMTRLSDAEYTSQVDRGTYTKFSSDAVGYGLCQWTYSTRKKALQNYAQTKGASIGDVTMQTEFCIKELKQDYSSLWKYLCSTTDISTATSRICKEYERPAINNIDTRLKYARSWYSALKGTAAKAEAPKSEYWPPRTIDAGMSGPDVSVWQAVMQARGYKCSITGEFDYDTLLATLAFQRDSGLKDDGIPGPLSWGAALKM